MTATLDQRRIRIVSKLMHWPADIGRIIAEYAARTEAQKLACLLRMLEIERRLPDAAATNLREYYGLDMRYEDHQWYLYGQIWIHKRHIQDDPDGWVDDWQCFICGNPVHLCQLLPSTMMPRDDEGGWRQYKADMRNLLERRF